MWRIIFIQLYVNLFENFITLNRNELKYIKQFNNSCLSKLLTVADRKFDKKINIVKGNEQKTTNDIEGEAI